MRNFPFSPAHICVLFFSWTAFGQDAAVTPFYVKVIDADSKRPVPLVEFRTSHQVRHVTDNAGAVVIDEPELVGREVYFYISSHGYEVEKDGFGYQGTRLQIELGKSVTIEIQRKNRAERMGRLTGAGRFSNAIQAGLRKQPANESAGVFGCDSVLNAVYKDRLFWIWGDTNKAGYPLGNFHSTGATTPLSLDLEAGFEFDFFENDSGFVKPVAKMPGEGPTWLTGLSVFPDAEGKPHLMATYQKIKGFLTLYETGICEWNDAKQEFQKVSELNRKSELPIGHPFEYEDEKGERWMVYADPIPTLKIPLRYEALLDPSQHVVVKPDVAFTDVETAEKIEPHRGHIAWNDYRKRWVMIFSEVNNERGKDDSRSQLGEVFFAESKSPFGPWRRCLKVATHDHYSFYNPKQHPEFQKGEGRVIYFEGTYTTSFSRAKIPTPRWDYNQVLYRLDLEKLSLEQD